MQEGLRAGGWGGGTQMEVKEVSVSAVMEADANGDKEVN